MNAIEPQWYALLASQADLEIEFAYRLMISELAPSFLHEMNNPLTVLSSSTGLLSRLEEESRERHEFLQSVAASSHSVAQLTASFNRILKARPRANTAKVPAITNAVGQICSDQIAVSGYRLKKAGLKASVWLPASLPPVRIAEVELHLSCYAAISLCIALFLASAPSRYDAHTLALTGEVTDATLQLRLVLPDKTLRNVFEAAESSRPEPLTHLLPNPLLQHLASADPFIIQTVEKILRHRTATVAWQAHAKPMALTLTLPVEPR